MLLLLLISLAASRNLQSTQDICYGAILDCGSSSTKTSVYQWKCRTTKSYPNIDTSIQAPNLKTKPPIASLTPDQVSTYLTDILSFIGQQVPLAKKGQTPIFLGATAGMRLLEINHQIALIDAFRNEISKSGYLFEQADWCRVISGQDEASYLWLTLKYLLNNAIIASIDLGGASTQIAFTITQQPYNSFINNITLPGQETYPLYSISYLGYGIDQARKSVVMLSHTGSTTITTPCYHQGYTSTWSDDTSYTISGTGNYQQCLQLISQFINSSCKTASEDNCGINQIEQPKIPTEAEIYAVSGVSIIADFYSLVDYKLPDLYAKSVEFCSLTWTQVQSNPTYASNPYISTNYFMSLYAYQLMKLGYNIPDTRTVHSPPTINQQSPTWGMAAVQYQLAQVNCNQDSPFCGDQILQILFILIVFLFN